MNLNRRIEQLENRMIPPQKVYRFIQQVGESSDEARQRYCQESGVTEEELEAGMVMRIVLVSPGDVKSSD